ncbi:hypothetical protein KQX54_008276 [Cotesia glomerata]|uniref:Uncharacterized protein n=1 Tax=Cotesia glomerata TaxID=32391 RepID=A0AAV7IZU3_COTGL|nr:hypothetical protein KQX54_008276 [Cotesia glomerata]
MSPTRAPEPSGPLVSDVELARYVSWNIELKLRRNLSLMLRAPAPALPCTCYPLNLKKINLMSSLYLHRRSIPTRRRSVSVLRC